MTDDSEKLLADSERHQFLYFMDGNVILYAPRPDKPGLLFRVHKSVLSSHSPIFMRMFEAYSPVNDDTDEIDSTSASEVASDTSSLYDGASLVRMSDDANDLESVLKILYYQSTLPWLPRSPHNPTRIAPLLVMSRTYMIDRIRQQIQGHLKSDWPQTLHDWDRLEGEIQLMTNDPRIARIDDHSPEPASAILLAHRFDIPSILPTAFYHLSRLSILDDWTKAHANPPIRTLNRTQRTAMWELLSAQDLRCLLLGKAEVAEVLHGCLNAEELAHRKTTTLFLSQRQASDNELCKLGKEVWKVVCDKCSRSADPLALLKSESWTFPNLSVNLIEEHNCITCLERLRAKIPAVRARMWEKLGDLFHLKDL